MRRWKPQNDLGLWIAVVLLIAALVAMSFVLMQFAPVLTQPPELWPVDLRLYAYLVILTILLAVVGSMAYRLIGRLTLAYEIDRNGLYIHWLGNRTIIPIDQIASIDSGVDASQPPRQLFGRLDRIGYYRGVATTADGKSIRLFATRPLDECLLIHTTAGSYAISPDNVDKFVQEISERQRLGSTTSLTEKIEVGRFFQKEFWYDAVIRRAILIALALNLLVFGLVAWRYPHLDALVAMRFDAAGQIVELRPRHQVLFLPLASLALGLLNVALGLAIFRREPIGARFLQWASAIVQILFGIAVGLIIWL